MAEALQFQIRAPHGLVFQSSARALRVPTQTGLAGLRPRGEPLVLAVDPGLVVIRADAGESFAATAGGLLDSGPDHCTLLTPFAVVGDSEQEMEDALRRMLGAPPSELVARRRLEELEQRIVSQLAHGPGQGARAVARAPTGERPEGQKHG